MGESPIGLLSTTVKPQQGSPTDLDFAREQLQSGENTDRSQFHQHFESSFFVHKSFEQISLLNPMPVNIFLSKEFFGKRTVPS
jgi:hypothetical protein